MDTRSSIFAIAAVALLLFSCTDRNAARNTPKRTLTQDDIAVGMRQVDFLSIFPQAKLTRDGQWNRPAELFGLEGDWTYSFNRNRLAWFIFNSYQPTVDQTNFNLYLDATQNAISSYSDRFGSPAQVVDGVMSFKDPAQGYSGYPVLKATWSTGKEKLRVDFSLLGSSNEEYQFLFTVEMRG